MSPSSSPRRGPVRRLVRWILIAVVLLVLAPYVLVPFYRSGEVVSALMLWRQVTGGAAERQWIDLRALSPALPRAVIAAEDAKFCSHRGIDWASLRDAVEDVQEGEVSGGGSTITQQVAKNLFLWPGRSYLRKALEVPLALWIDLVLPKTRVLEIYLNIAEWGPNGQFGAEAGSRFAFGKSARSLSAPEAALMAAVLPNPVTRSARNPAPGLRRMAGTYLARAAQADLSACQGKGPKGG